MTREIAVALAGLAVTLGLVGLRRTLREKFAADVEWMRQTSFRFNPAAIDARRRTLVFYAALAGLLGVLLLVMPGPAPAIGLWLIVAYLPKPLVEMAWERRRRKIDEQLPEAISTMCGCVKSGLTLVQAVGRLGAEAPQPLRTEFRIMSNRYAHGTDLDATVLEAKHRLRLPNFNIFAAALLVNREMGGDVAATLDRIAMTLEKLKQMRRTVEAHTAEGRTNVKVLLMAPVFILLMMYVMDPEGVMMLFQTIQGWMILAVAGVLSGLGIFWASKIVGVDI